MDTDLKKKITTASNQNSLILIMWLILTLVFQVVLYVVAMIFSPTVDPEMLDRVYNLAAYLAQYVGAVPLAILISKSIFGDKGSPSFRTAFQKPQASGGQLVRWIFISFFFIYGTAIASNLLFTLLEAITGIELHSVDMTTDENLLSRITSVISMMFLAPFFEETMFRANIVRNGSRFGSWNIIIITGLTFGLWHCNYEQLLYAGVMGICAGFLTVKTRSVIPSLVLHFIMNTIGTVQSMTLGTLDQDKLNDTEYIMSNLGAAIAMMCSSGIMYALVITGLVLFIIELNSHKDTFVLDDPVPEKGEVTKTYLTAPLTIIMFLVFIAATLLRAFVI